ncbi:MAG: hypothetical protein ACXVIJ_15025, partial [Thermoanaerobaculia bacterium]
MIPILLLAVTITFRPPTPTVGDLITVETPPQSAPLVLDPSPQYEIVSRLPSSVVIRTFEPKSVVLAGTAGKETFSGIVIPVRSVLQKNDAMEPAPLIPPRQIPYPRAPSIAIAVTALVAIAAWLAVFLLAKRLARARAPLPLLTPIERFRSEVNAATGWAALADATRHYLAAHGYGPELTTRELLSRAPEEIRPVLIEVLREGDLDKFSPWGSAASDFSAASARALTLAELLEPKAEAEV